MTTKRAIISLIYMMKKILLILCAILPAVAGAQTFETRYERSVHDLMKDVGQRFGVKFKFDSTTTGTGGNRAATSIKSSCTNIRAAMSRRAR